MSNALTISFILLLILLFISLSVIDNSYFYNSRNITPKTLEKRGYILLKHEKYTDHYENAIENMKMENGFNFDKFEIYKSSPNSYAYILAYYHDDHNKYMMIEII